MRQIKFRGKRINNGQWVYGDYFKTPLTDENLGTQRHCIGSNGCAYVIDPNTLGQFTGHKDKSGVEIFEGDILQGNPKAPKFEVTFENGCFMWGGEPISYDFDETDNGIPVKSVPEIWANVISK